VVNKEKGPENKKDSFNKRGHMGGVHIGFRQSRREGGQLLLCDEGKEKRIGGWESTEPGRGDGERFMEW